MTNTNYIPSHTDPLNDEFAQWTKENNFPSDLNGYEIIKGIDGCNPTDAQCEWIVDFIERWEIAASKD